MQDSTLSIMQGIEKGTDTMKPLKCQPGFHETFIMAVFYDYSSPSWFPAQRVESHIKREVIDPVANTLYVALLDTIDKMPLRKDAR